MGGRLCRSNLWLRRLWYPLGREFLFILWQLIKSSDIVTKPQVELQVLGRVFNIQQEVHKLAGGAGL